ncbi:MAG TPA: prepilin-type N-terminal cleavage/methylation domain-containing protein [Fimbriimonadales bacterium]|nr:prepilin-type N-terminal cleavage/methylation domain-containing protein [Fimbriimonadales bacterium]
MVSKKSGMSAFTLIELLVVIAIIAIIAAILFPVFEQAKRQSKQTVCLSNMNQLGLAMMNYLSAWDDTWPACSIYSPLSGFAPQQMWIGYDNNNGGLYGGFWGRVNQPAKNKPRPGAIDPYIQNHDVRECPVMPEEWQMSYAHCWWNEEYWSGYYSKNPKAYQNEWGPTVKTVNYVSGCVVGLGASQSEVNEPARTLIMWEHNAWVPLCNFLQPENWYDSPPNSSYLINHFHFLHRGGANSLWGDGHVKRMVYGLLKRPYFSSRKDIYPDWW